MDEIDYEALAQEIRKQMEWDREQMWEVLHGQMDERAK